MVFLENLQNRVREWRDASEDPDLVVRMRRIWEAEPDSPTTAGVQREASRPRWLSIAARSVPTASVER